MFAEPNDPRARIVRKHLSINFGIGYLYLAHWLTYKGDCGICKPSLNLQPETLKALNL